MSWLFTLRYRIRLVTVLKPQTRSNSNDVRERTQEDDGRVERKEREWRRLARMYLRKE